MEIPQKTIPRQVNKGDKYGDIYASWNLDLLSNVGKFRVSPNLRIQAGTVESSSEIFSTLRAPIAFVRNMSDTASGAAVDSYFSICSQKVYKLAVANLSSSSFQPDTLSSSPTTGLSNLYSDAVDFGGTLVVTEKTQVDKLTSGTWSTNWLSISLTDSKPHPACVGFDKLLYIGNGNNIVQIQNVSTYNATRLILSAEYEVQWIRSSTTSYWIGCKHLYGGEGKVFQWDGASEYVTGDYGIKSSMTYAGVIKDEIPYTVNGNGQLLAFNGGGFVEVDRFPIANELYQKWGQTQTVLSRNGMAVINGAINILISCAIDNTYEAQLENFLSGIWEYTPDTGLYHKYGINNRTDASEYNYGVPTLTQAGGLFPLNNTNQFFAGADINIGSTPDPKGVICWINGDTKNKQGYFITPKIYAEDAEQTWQKLWLVCEKLLNTGDSITIKYRTSKSIITSFDQPGAWTSTTTFTTTATEFADVESGDEIEIMTGEGSGLSATITNITGTYTVTIDTVQPGASGNFLFRTANWTKIDSLADLVQTFKEFSVGQQSSWIQFKVLMFGKGNSPEINKIIIDSNKHQ